MAHMPPKTAWARSSGVRHQHGAVPAGEPVEVSRAPLGSILRSSTWLRSQPPFCWDWRVAVVDRAPPGGRVERGALDSRAVGELGAVVGQEQENSLRNAFGAAFSSMSSADPVDAAVLSGMGSAIWNLNALRYNVKAGTGGRTSGRAPCPSRRRRRALPPATP